MRSAILSGSMLLPTEAIDIASVSDALTVKVLPMGETIPVKVLPFAIDFKTKTMRVPRQYGIKLCNKLGIEIDDRTSEGVPVKFPKIPVPRPYQVPFLDEVMACTENYYDFIAKAHTGFGKTISSLIIAARLGRSTVVIVDQTNLRDQWLEPLKDLFGMTIEGGHIGIIQGPKCDYKGKIVTLAMIQTLSQRKFKQEVYDYFGTAIFDEVHITGAPTFSEVLQHFSATIRFGVSATPIRKNSSNALIQFNLGKVRAAAEKEHAESSVYYMLNQSLYSWYGNVSPKVGRIITEVSEDGARNRLICDTLTGLLENDRDTIAMSDRIDHLNDLRNMMYYMGVDEDDIGLYTGRQPFYRFAKEPKPARRPYGLIKDAEYTPVSLQLIAKKIPKARLEHVKNNAKLILSTYGMTAKAFDVPRLSAGMDLTPRSTAEQIQGRILRELKGKKKPIWVTILDINNYRLVYSFVGRLQDYPKSNSRVFEWNEHGELTECQAKTLTKSLRQRIVDLKAMRIVTRADGSNMLQTQREEKKIKLTAAKDTVSRIRSRSQS